METLIRENALEEVSWGIGTNAPAPVDQAIDQVVREIRENSPPLFRPISSFSFPLPHSSSYPISYQQDQSATAATWPVTKKTEDLETSGNAKL